MGIIVFHKLLVISEALWFWLMGRGRVQQRAMAEVAALPLSSGFKKILSNFNQNTDLMVFSPELLSPANIRNRGVSVKVVVVSHRSQLE
jgi:hypothetical protein